jgi:transcription-repair coupling factor (superfamily II helicase)
VEVEARLDFLAMNPADEAHDPVPSPESPKETTAEIQVRRDVATYVESTGEKPDRSPPPPKTPAYIPLNYIPESQHRIDFYRKLAQAADKATLEHLKGELRDRFGPLPPSADLLFKVSELKILASDRDITSIEAREGKVMLTRLRDFIMVNGRFPRLSKPTATGKLGEIKKLLLAL